MIEPAPAVAAWYDREAEYVQRAVDLIRVYQFTMPDGIGPYHDHAAPWPRDWWDEFWSRLEHESVVEHRQVFHRSWIERHAPGGYQQSLGEVFGVDHDRHAYIVAGQRELADYQRGDA